MSKKVFELLKEGGKWNDERWHEMIKTPDGHYWKPAPGTKHSMPDNDDTMVLVG